MATRPECFELTQMLRPCKNSLALGWHSAFPDEAPHVLFAPSLRCGWYSPVMGSKTTQQLKTLATPKIIPPAVEKVP